MCVSWEQGLKRTKLKSWLHMETDRVTAEEPTLNILRRWNVQPVQHFLFVVQCISHLIERGFQYCLYGKNFEQ